MSNLVGVTLKLESDWCPVIVTTAVKVIERCKALNRMSSFQTSKMLKFYQKRKHQNWRIIRFKSWRLLSQKQIKLSGNQERFQGAKVMRDRTKVASIHRNLKPKRARNNPFECIKKKIKEEGAQPMMWARATWMALKLFHILIANTFENSETQGHQGRSKLSHKSWMKINTMTSFLKTK